MVEQVCMSEALLGAAKEVFETMVFMSLEESFEPEQSEQSEPDEAVLGTITFRNSIEGCLFISCGSECAKSIAQNMLGLDSADELSNEEVYDAVGEVANMVMGSVKSRVIEFAPDLQISIPTVVRGEKLEHSLVDGAEKVSSKLSLDGIYAIELSFLYRDSRGDSTH